MGEAPDATILVQDVAEAEALDLPADARVAYVTQTTLSVDETAEIIGTLRRRFPAIVGPKKEDICYATSNRQWAVKDMLAEIDLLLVIGSRNSSNSNRLVDVARAAGGAGASDRRRDGDRRELARGRRDRRHHVRRVRARATRDARVRLVQGARRGRIEPYRMVDEDVTFRLPVELRRELALAEQPAVGQTFATVTSSPSTSSDVASVSALIHSACSTRSASCEGIERLIRSVIARPDSLRIELTRWISS